MTLLDSSVLIDVFTRRSDWTPWSCNALATALDGGDVVVNPIVYAEVSVGFGSVEEYDDALAGHGVRLEELPRPAAFLAGKSFVAYRRRGGRKQTPLPDFFIGAHAAVHGYKLLTRDPGRFRSYFPQVELIAPA